jgi:hypothetical protein
VAQHLPHCLADPKGIDVIDALESRMVLAKTRRLLISSRRLLRDLDEHSPTIRTYGETFGGQLPDRLVASEPILNQPGPKFRRRKSVNLTKAAQGSTKAASGR